MRAVVLGAVAAVTLASAEVQAAIITYDFSGYIGLKTDDPSYPAVDPLGEFTNETRYTGYVTLDTEAVATDIRGTQGSSVEVAYYSAVTDWSVNFKHSPSFSGDYGTVVLGNDAPRDRFVVTMYGGPDEPIESGRDLRYFQIDVAGFVESESFDNFLDSEEIPLNIDINRDNAANGRLFLGDSQIFHVVTSFERSQLPGCEASGGQPQKCDDLPSPVPLPASVWLFAAALAGLGLASRRP